MSKATKILSSILLLVTGVLILEVYLYWSGTQKIKPEKLNQAVNLQNQAGSGFKTPTQSAKTVEIKDLALVGNLNLVDLSLAQVKTWTTSSGTRSVTAYSGPVPTLPPDLATLSAGIRERPTKTDVLAGSLKSLSGQEITLLQNGKDVKVTLNASVLLWLKTGSNLQMTRNPNLALLLKVGDLVLIPGVQTVNGQFQTSNVAVFR